MKPIPFAEINRELVPKDPLEQAQFGAALFEKCRLAHNAEPKTPEGKRRQKTLWLPRIRAACKLIAEARMLLPEPKGEFDIRFDKRAFLNSDIGAKRLGLIDIGKSFEKTPIHDTADVDPLEDFTTYVEYDPRNWIAITSTQVTVTNMDGNAPAYVYKDRGIDHFDTFTHYFTTRLTDASTTTEAVGAIWAVSNVINELRYWTINNSQALACFYLVDVSQSIYKCVLRNCEYGNRQDDYSPINLGTTYYMVSERNGSSITLYIYSDPERTTLVDALAVPLQSMRKYRYIFTAVSHNDNWRKEISYIIRDLDLSEIAFNAAWADRINVHHS